MAKIKSPFGIIENNKIVKKFSENPKTAAKEFFESNLESDILDCEIDKISPYKNPGKWLRDFGIEITKLKLKNTDSGEERLILSSRTLDELSHIINVLNNREEILSGFDSFKISLENAKKLKDKLENKIHKESYLIAPNLTTLVGPVLTANLISQARGLKNLAKMPSSKIQIIGAEKSLFKHLADKESNKIPKYGIIYKSTYIQEAKKGFGGKIARLLSAKLMVAARLDYFSDENKGGELKEKLIEEIKKINKKD